VHSPKSIVLIGFMGAGKSSVGRCLERRVGLGRIDTDELVAKKFEMAITDIFAKHGEPRFREAETEILRGLALPRPAIIVTGGGTVLRNENVDLLKRLGTIVWLNADENVLFERATRKSDRPLLQTEDPRTTFRSLFAARHPIYASAADIRIDTSNLTHEQVAEMILKEIDQLTPQ
jgi:shikimate kinase